MMPLLLPWMLMTAGAEARLTTGIVVEAEAMTLEGGWKAVRVGGGNLVADQTGLGHVSGERVALLPADQSGRATATVTIPKAGTHALWVRRERRPVRGADRAIRQGEAICRRAKAQPGVRPR